jgi:7,8-dihydropterin-6-yl-methyl-4-(beta-D-ribofuranosyl)aminobenzene 5'-phosphate synthase
MKITKADRIEITTLTDNYTDIFAPSSDKVKRQPLMSEGNLTKGLIAEHGLSWLIDIFDGSNSHRILFDFGWNDFSVPFNLEAMGISLSNVEATILSHGHLDHFGSLIRLYKEGIVPKSVPFIVHPDAFNQRYLFLPTGNACIMPQLTRLSLNHLGITVKENKNPLSLASDLALVTGEIERITDFEPGFPPQRKFEGGELKPDNLVLDEQAMVFNVKNKGLIILSSCSHPGIINTILYAQKLTEEKKIYAVIGGFHLNGPFESLIDRTIIEMKKFNPEVIVPTHCTGMNAIKRFEEEMPEQFILNTVGAKYYL